MTIANKTIATTVYSSFTTTTAVTTRTPPTPSPYLSPSPSPSPSPYFSSSSPTPSPFGAALTGNPNNEDMEKASNPLPTEKTIFARTFQYHQQKLEGQVNSQLEILGSPAFLIKEQMNRNSCAIYVLDAKIKFLSNLGKGQKNWRVLVREYRNDVERNLNQGLRICLEDIDRKDAYSKDGVFHIIKTPEDKLKLRQEICNEFKKVIELHQGYYDKVKPKLDELERVLIKEKMALEKENKELLPLWTEKEMAYASIATRAENYTKNLKVILNVDEKSTLSPEEQELVSYLDLPPDHALNMLNEMTKSEEKIQFIKNNYVPLLNLSCKLGRKDIVCFLIDLELTINVPFEGYYPIHYAAMCEDSHVGIEILEILKLKGKDFNVDVKQEYHGRTALHTSTLFSNFAVTKWLVEKGAQANVVEKGIEIQLLNRVVETGKLQKQTPLHNAAFAGDLKTIEFLLNILKEEDKYLLNHTKLTPLAEAIFNFEKIDEEKNLYTGLSIEKRIEIAKLFYSKGVKLTPNDLLELRITPDKNKIGSTFKEHILPVLRAIGEK